MSQWEVKTYKSSKESNAAAFGLFSGINLPDLRLSKRLIHCTACLLRRPNAAFSNAISSWKDIKAWYRFTDNKRVKPEAIMSYLANSTAERCQKKERIFVASDTTEIVFPKTQIRECLGYGSSSKSSRAFQVHTSIAIDTDGVPLGLVHQKCWNRDRAQYGKRVTRANRPIEEKESYKWIESVQGTLQAFQSLESAPQIVMLGDRESDIFEYFSYIKSQGVDAIIRSRANRRLINETSLMWDHVSEQPLDYKVCFEVPRRPKHPSRTVELGIKYATNLLLKKPEKVKGKYAPVAVNMIHVEELNPVKPDDALRWRIVTTLPINSGKDAWGVAQNYKYRWLTEEFHYILKSGCRVEKLQYRTFDRLVRALTILSGVSFELLRYKYLARIRPDLPASEYFLPDQLYVLKLKIKMNRWRAPPDPMTIHTAVKTIARIGGYLDRKHDGEPGAKTLWLGWNEVCAIAEMIPILKEELS